MATISALPGEPSFVSALRVQALAQLSAFSDTPAPHGNPITAIIDVAEEDRAAFQQSSQLNPEEAATYFAALVPLEPDPQVLRHYAFLSGLLILSIPSGVIFQKPIRIRWESTHAWTSTHTLILLGEGAQCTIEEECSGGGAEWSHGTEVHAAREATLEYVSFQHMNPSVRAWLKQRSRLSEGSCVQWHLATLGGAQTTHSLVSQAEGPFARTDINWLFYAKDKERQQLSCRNIFAARDGSGEILMRGVAENHAHVSSDGMIDIGAKGSGTNTYLTQQVLMLDATARVDAVPGLEIKTNDVKASHSATVARVTEEDLFYFAARGIPREEARGMFVMGFLADVASKMPGAKDRVTAAILKKYDRKILAKG